MKRTKLAAVIFVVAVLWEKNAQGQISGLSTRAEVGTGTAVLVNEFMVTGSASRKIYLTGLGPSLPGSSGLLADPTLVLSNSSATILASNDNWKDTQEAAVRATGFAPTNDLESAIIITLTPGTYVAVERGNNGGTGLGVNQVVDITGDGKSAIIAGGSRGGVVAGNAVAGALSLTNQQKILVRALGPSLGITGTIPDPTLQLFNNQGTALVSNDNWRDTQQNEIQNSGLAPSNSKEAAFVATLAAGGYTIFANGKNASGIVFTQSYVLPASGPYTGTPLAANPPAPMPTLVSSTFNGAASAGDYSDASRWVPAQVPNNTSGTLYSTTITGGTANLDIDATVTNLNLTTNGGLNNSDHLYTVTGKTNDTSQFMLLLPNAIGLNVNCSTTDALISAGTLANLTGTTLTGGHFVITDTSNGSHSATLRARGANIVKLAGAFLLLDGVGSHFVDENGADALRNLANIDKDSSFQIGVGRNFTTAGNLTNDGKVGVSGDQGKAAMFTVNGSITNYQASTRTLTNGTYDLESFGPLARLQFDGADIVNNGDAITLTGENAQILDQHGADGLRNFAHNLNMGTFFILARSFVTSGNFTNDGELDIAVVGGKGSFKVNGSLTNFNGGRRTLTGGKYDLLGDAINTIPATLQFKSADIVHNSASLICGGPAKIMDESGHDGLRNFVDNQSAGSFEIDSGFAFTASSSFANAGAVTINSTTFTVPLTHAFNQSKGSTTLIEGTLSAPNAVFAGGKLTGFGTIKGNVSVDAATIELAQSRDNPFTGKTEVSPGLLQVNGTLNLSNNSQVLFALAGAGAFDQIKVSGPVELGGMLQVSIVDGFVPKKDDSFTVLSGGKLFTGAFANVANGSRLTTIDRSGSFLVTYSGSNVVLSDFEAGVVVGPAQLLNIATRMEVLGGDQVLIAGFIVTGKDKKEVLIRGIGPSLKGVGTTVSDPTLELHQGSITIATNDNWKINDKTHQSQEAQIRATTIPPTNDLESVILATLSPGAYTAILAGKNGGTGVGLVELYDLAQNANSKLANISTRGFVDTDNNVMIGGVIIGPTQSSGAQVIVRAIGPSLAAAGVQGALGDPTLELHDGTGATIATNDNWKLRPDGTSQQAEIQATTVAPTSDLESAILVTLPAGSYTAIVRGKNNGTGIGLVEAYDLQ